MSQFVPLSASRHADWRWKRFQGYYFAAGDTVVPLVAAELPRAAIAMPLAFVTISGKPTLVALTGLEPGSNLFIGKDNRWLGSYVPSFLRSYPFRLLPVQGRDESVLCFDAEGGLIGEADALPDGEALFEDGKPAKPVQATVDFLKQVEASRVTLERAVAAIVEAGLLEAWPVPRDEAGQVPPLSGVERISEQRLNALDDAAFLKLRASGALAVVYAQLLSTQHLPMLRQLAKLKAGIRQQGAAAPARQEKAAIVGANEDGTLRFNF